MQYSGPYRFHLLLSGSENKRTFLPKEKTEKKFSFHPEVMTRSQPKIYVLKSAGEIVYVGYASQSIAMRLRQGMRANGLNGYHGYKWRHLEEVELVVFVFEKLFSDDAEEKASYKSYVEAIEAELVYIVRREKGQWPMWQNEIHFNNDHGQGVIASAEDMYSKINLY